MSTSLINTEILPFKASAFHAGQFVEVTNATLKGKWSVVFFYPADFTFVCPTELGDLADNYAAFQKLGVDPINQAVRGALMAVTLADLLQPAGTAPVESMVAE